MPLALYGHRFSSYTQKVLIALYENNIPFEFRNLAPEQPDNLAEWLRRWPIAKFPLLVDGDKQVVEASIIIEYLGINYPGPVRLVPADLSQALNTRFLDRFFDLYIMDPVQLAVGAALGRIPMTAEDGRSVATDRLERSYAWLETWLKGRTWASGETFSLADCAAAPSLFYAAWTHPIGNDFPNTLAYRARLLARPSFARIVEEARAHRALFPLGAPDRD